MNKRWTLEGKRALITGGTKGIGRAITEEFLRFGAELIIVARTAEDIDNTVSQFRGGHQIQGIVADISKNQGLRRIADFLNSSGKHLNILVNNVATNIRKKTIDYIDEEYDLIMATNLKSAFKLCKIAYPLLKKSTGSSIVNISSTAGVTHIKSGSIYGMTKAALVQLTKNLACEWAEDDIRVNAIAPWYIMTPLTEGVLKDPEYYKAVISRTPLRKIGNPEDIAAAVAFFCMPAANFITGQCLTIDGGLTVYGF
jgi:Tropinone reductase 1